VEFPIERMQRVIAMAMTKTPRDRRNPILSFFEIEIRVSLSMSVGTTSRRPSTKTFPTAIVMLMITPTEHSFPGSGRICQL